MIDAAREIAQLREKAFVPFGGSDFLSNPNLRFPLLSTRILQVCFESQRMLGLSTERMLAGMAIALAEALDSKEELVLGYVNRSLPAPMMLCPECPNKEKVLSSLSQPKP
jgi:hypothetical protein